MIVEVGLLRVRRRDFHQGVGLLELRQRDSDHWLVVEVRRRDLHGRVAEVRQNLHLVVQKLGSVEDA